ncbi:phage terminase small subunit-related protein [Paenibacillus sanguinis]|uniref:phage terminase small subunit-related protein n=1 Tax=Paenibacillus sanguinis TaxID=225906 RepID=UPI0003A8098E|nr:phage terminase small subunit-related protein [Paenibacillus sanguinis]
MKLKDIAAALSVPDNEVRKWKTLDNWDTALNGIAPSEPKGSAPRRGVPKGNKNAVGNRGGGAPPGNQNAKGNRGGSGGPPRNTKAVKTGNFKHYGWMH